MKKAWIALLKRSKATKTQGVFLESASSPILTTLVSSLLDFSSCCWNFPIWENITNVGFALIRKQTPAAKDQQRVSEIFSGGFSANARISPQWQLKEVVMLKIAHFHKTQNQRCKLLKEIFGFPKLNTKIKKVTKTDFQNPPNQANLDSSRRFGQSHLYLPKK